MPLLISKFDIYCNCPQKICIPLLLRNVFFKFCYKESHILCADFFVNIFFWCSLYNVHAYPGVQVSPGSGGGVLAAAVSSSSPRTSRENSANKEWVSFAKNQDHFLGGSGGLDRFGSCCFISKLPSDLDLWFISVTLLAKDSGLFFFLTSSWLPNCCSLLPLSLFHSSSARRIRNRPDPDYLHETDPNLSL